MPSPDIQFINGASAAATTITIPAGHQNGDVLIIFAFNNASTTIPSLPSGWTQLVSNASTLSAMKIGWKLATSAAESSGTWTNATGLVCMVYRGASTVKTPMTSQLTNPFVGNNATLTYGSLQTGTPQGRQGWAIGFAGHRTATDVATPPTGMTNRVNGSTIAGHDSNGQVGWNQQTVGVNASSGWGAATLLLMPEALGPLNNYQFVKVGNGMSASERIR